MGTRAVVESSNVPKRKSSFSPKELVSLKRQAPPAKKLLIPPDPLRLFAIISVSPAKIIDAALLSMRVNCFLDKGAIPSPKANLLRMGMMNDAFPRRPKPAFDSLPAYITSPVL